MNWVLIGVLILAGILIVITPQAQGSLVNITENGEVYNPIFRFVSRFIMGHTASIDAYLKALQAR